MKSDYRFDHNGDGREDLSFHPVTVRHLDSSTRYMTLQEALSNEELTLREDPSNYGPRRSTSGRSTHILAANLSGASIYYQGGTQLGGGGQGRGLRGGGVIGAGAGRGGYRGAAGARGRPTGGRGLRGRGFGAAGIGGIRLDAMCFEKGRLIQQSMRSGASEFFTYAGMASPSVRKLLVLPVGQSRVDRVVASELRRLGVSSRTKSLADIFGRDSIASVVDYYVNGTKRMLSENKDICGMIVKLGDGRILCADVYSSPSLFAKMLPQLAQSAALEVCTRRRAKRRHPSEGDVSLFVRALQGPQPWKQTSPQTHTLISRGLISQATLHSDGSTPKVVHVEAYPD
jgi:hypothetical protein